MRNIRINKNKQSKSFQGLKFANVNPYISDLWNIKFSQKVVKNHKFLDFTLKIPI